MTKIKQKRTLEDESTTTLEFEVEKILARKIRSGKKYYLIKWKGYDQSHNSWEPETNLKNSKKLLLKFNNSKNENNNEEEIILTSTSSNSKEKKNKNNSKTSSSTSKTINKKKRMNKKRKKIIPKKEKKIRRKKIKIDDEPIEIEENSIENDDDNILIIDLKKKDKNKSKNKKKKKEEKKPEIIDIVDLTNENNVTKKQNKNSQISKNNKTKNNKKNFNITKNNNNIENNSNNVDEQTLLSKEGKKFYLLDGITYEELINDKRIKKIVCIIEINNEKKALIIYNDESINKDIEKYISVECLKRVAPLMLLNFYENKCKIYEKNIENNHNTIIIDDKKDYSNTNSNSNSVYINNNNEFKREIEIK